MVNIEYLIFSSLCFVQYSIVCYTIHGNSQSNCNARRIVKLLFLSFHDMHIRSLFLSIVIGISISHYSTPLHTKHRWILDLLSISIWKGRNRIEWNIYNRNNNQTSLEITLSCFWLFRLLQITVPNIMESCIFFFPSSSIIIITYIKECFHIFFLVTSSAI